MDSMAYILFVWAMATSLYRQGKDNTIFLEEWFRIVDEKNKTFAPVVERGTKT